MTERLWPALVVSFTPPAGQDLSAIAERVAVVLDDLRPTAIEERDADWDVFFATAGDRDRAAEALPAALPGLVRVTAADVPDGDWARRSQENLGPVRVGRFTIAPPQARVPRDNLTVIIQPSMGFGTGHHATTRLCTALLQQVDVAGKTVLDVGTGSGVLAIIARRLGARSVAAVDDDPDALQSARENLDLNDAREGIDLRLADFRDLADLRADVLTANLTGALLIRGAARLAAAMAESGVLILSGVTAGEERDVVAAFAPLRVLARLAEDEWVGLLLGR